MAYEKMFNKPYSDGWEDFPSEDTPITAEILNNIDKLFEHMENGILGNDNALQAFINQINRDYYGAGSGAVAFDLMPGGTTGTALSRLGSCYISSSAQVEEFHAPSTGYAFAFGSSRDRYGIIFISRAGGKVWYRSESTDWIDIDAALSNRMDKFSLSNGRTMLASDLVTDLNDIDFNCVVNADAYADAAYVENCPATVGWWFVQTFRHAQNADFRKQIAIRMDTDSTEFRIRTCISGTWGEWKSK